MLEASSENNISSKTSPTVCHVKVSWMVLLDWGYGSDCCLPDIHGLRGCCKFFGLLMIPVYSRLSDKAVPYSILQCYSRTTVNCGVKPL